MEKIEENMAVIETVAPPSVIDIVDDGNITAEDVMEENDPVTVVEEQTPAATLQEASGLEEKEDVILLEIRGSINEIGTSQGSLQELLQTHTQHLQKMQILLEELKNENTEIKKQLKKIQNGL